MATTNTTAVGGIIGVEITETDAEEVYYASTITKNGGEVDGISFGAYIDDLSLFDEDFFITTLEWDPEVWDFTNLDVINNVYPNLIFD